MLKEVERIIEECDAAGGNGEELEQELRQAAHTLWRAQFLYESDWRTKNAYDAIRRYRFYFQNLFEALGYDLVGKPNDRLIGLLAIDPPARQTLKLDESLMLLVMRLYYEEALKRYELNESGEVEVESETIVQVYEDRTHRARPGIVRLNEIITAFRQRGLLRVGEQQDNRNFTLFLRPALPMVIGEEALVSLEEYVAKSGAAEAERTPEMEQSA